MSWPVQGKEARQSERLGSWRCGRTSRVNNCFGCGNILGKEALRVAFLVRGASMENCFVKGTVSYVLQFFEKVRIAFNANLWGIWNGCVSF